MAAIDEVGGAAGLSGPADGGAGGVMGEIEQGGAATRLNVVSTSPEDLATDVERDTPVAVTFTAPLDPESVTLESFSVTNEDGAVAGKLAVKGTTITFTPAATYPLLAEYTVQLSDEIRSLDGAALEEAASFEFRARDGKWRTPERLSPTLALNLTAFGTRPGHVAAFWETPSFIASEKPKSRAVVAIFEPARAAWLETALLPDNLSTNYSAVCAAINDNGEGFATFGTLKGSTEAGGRSVVSGHWSRTVATGWGPAHFDAFEGPRSCALADDGTALTLWNQGESLVASTALAIGIWSKPHVLGAEANVLRASQFRGGFLTIQSRRSDHALLSSTYSADQGWSGPDKISEAVLNARVVVSNDAAMAVWSDQSKKQIVASQLEADEWSRPSEVAPDVSGGAISIRASWLMNAGMCSSPGRLKTA